MTRRRVWKFGCNWERNPRSFLKFIREIGIVIGRSEKTPYEIGDLVLICEGFAVRAIVEVKTEPIAITNRSQLKLMSNNYGVRFDSATTVADAQWRVLSNTEQFEYQMQKGACRVRRQEIIDCAHRLWNEGS